MPETVACHVVESHLDYKLGPKWLPFAAALGTPPTRTARCFARESRRAAKLLQFSCQNGAVRVRYRGRKADVVELAISIVKPQQQRPDLSAFARIAEPADNAIRRPESLHLDHAALARCVTILKSLGYHAISATISGGS
jgi:hypothetical protein